VTTTMRVHCTEVVIWPLDYGAQCVVQNNVSQADRPKHQVHKLLCYISSSQVLSTGY